MCGIVGYIGKQEATNLLVDGLRRLEYRGYDSAGVAVLGADAERRRRFGAQHAGRALPRQAVRARGAAAQEHAARPRRHRPHPLGHPRPPVRRKRPPALLQDGGGGPQRHHRELPGAQRSLWCSAATPSCPRPTPRSSPTSSTRSSCIRRRRTKPRRTTARIGCSRPPGGRCRSSPGPTRSSSCPPRRPTRSCAPRTPRRWSSALARARRSSPRMCRRFCRTPGR